MSKGPTGPVAVPGETKGGAGPSSATAGNDAAAVERVIESASPPSSAVATWASTAWSAGVSSGEEEAHSFIVFLLQLALSLGESSPPFGSIKEGVRVLMLCGRDDPKVDGGPSFDQMMSQMEDDRVNKRAQAYLRDLRRDAVIDYN